MTNLPHQKEETYFIGDGCSKHSEPGEWSRAASFKESDITWIHKAWEHRLIKWDFLLFFFRRWQITTYTCLTQTSGWMVCPRPPSFEKWHKKLPLFMMKWVLCFLTATVCFLFLPWNGSEFFKENKSLRVNMRVPAGMTCMTDMDQTGVSEHLAPVWEMNEILTDNFTAARLSRLFPVKATNRWCRWCLLVLGPKAIFTWPSLSVRNLLSASCTEVPTGWVLCRSHH